MREHGTYACYIHGLGPGDTGGCRCGPCREANRIYERERTRRPEPPYVGAGRARTRLAELAEAGVGLKRVAEISGLSGGTLSKLVYGTSGRPPSKRIRKETEDKILAVSADDQAPGARIPAGPTWRNVEELLGRGWTKVAIAHAIGQTGQGLQLSRRAVTKANADSVAALLEQPVPARRSRWGIHEIEEAAPEPGEGETPDLERFRRYDLPRFSDKSDTAWMDRGACKIGKVEPWVFFPARGDMETLAAARDVCATCSVADDCLEYALRNRLSGIWGGTSDRQRRWLRREAAS